MRARISLLVSLTVLAVAGCGWSPPSGNQAAQSTAACAAGDAPGPDVVAAQIATLPAGGQWREVGRGHTTDCRLNWVQVADGTAPDASGQVLFFDRAAPLGTPTPQPRPYVSVVTSGADTVTVQYQWRQGGDQACCPTGIGTARFRAGDGGLDALDPIPGP